jgi:hypothetical protein
VKRLAVSNRMRQYWVPNLPGKTAMAALRRTTGKQPKPVNLGRPRMKELWARLALVHVARRVPWTARRLVTGNLLMAAVLERRLPRAYIAWLRRLLPRHLGDASPRTLKEFGRLDRGLWCAL